jgi:hypothetical protein
MKRSRFSEEQIIGISKETEGGVGRDGLCAAQRQPGDVLPSLEKLPNVTAA